MVATHPGMSDQTNTNIARDGAAKKPQTNFPVKSGMKNSNDTSKLQGISPKSPGFGPDAGGPSVLDPSKGLKKFGDVKATWNMKDANGDSINNESGRQVLSEAALLGR